MAVPPRRAMLYGAGCVGALALLAALNFTEAVSMRSPGVVIPGHASLACDDCHKDAPGTARQQLQANLQFALGRRKSPVYFGRVPISDRDCVGCHQRISDRHPISRLREPRFVEAWETLGVNRCVGCHLEHSGRRVRHEPDFCMACHKNLDIKEDPIDPSHRLLIQDTGGAGCLGCHDFHGNHDRTTPVDHADTISPDVIRRYLAAGDNPYGPVSVPAQAPDP